MVLAPLLLSASACAPVTRVRRALAPESFVTPEQPVGRYASVVVNAGWSDLPPVPYFPPESFVRDGVRWVEPVSLTDRAQITISPLDGPITIDLLTRHTGLVQRDFQQVEARSGSLPGTLPTTLRFVPDGPLDSPYTVQLRDLKNVYSDDPLADGDLLLIEVGAPNLEPDRYLFRLFDYGWRTRAGAGVLFRVPLPFEDQQGVTLSPALTLSLAVGYRARSRDPVLRFVNDRLMLVGSVGIGSTALTGTQGLDQRIAGAFNAAVIGGGIEAFELVNLQILGNASAPFRDDLESDWALAIGFDAVQAARFADKLGARLLREHPMTEDRRNGDAK